MQSTNPESTVIPSQTSTNNYLSRRVTPGAGGPLINWPKGVAGDDEPDWVLDALGLLASTVARPCRLQGSCCRPLGLPDHDGSESGGGRRWPADPLPPARPPRPRWQRIRGWEEMVCRSTTAADRRLRMGLARTAARADGRRPVETGLVRTAAGRDHSGRGAVTGGARGRDSRGRQLSPTAARGRRVRGSGAGADWSPVRPPGGAAA